MENIIDILKSQLVRVKKFFSTSFDKIEKEKTPQELVKYYQEEEIVIKSLFDNDLIDLDEYLEKIKTISDRIREALKQDTTVYNYADAIIRDVKGNILFLRRTSNDPLFPNYWGLPGGKVDPGETPEQAMKREVMEETGMTVRECYLVAKKTLKDKGCIWYYNCYVKNIDDNIILNNEEHFSYQYISKYDYHRYNFIKDLKDILREIEDFYTPKNKVINLVIKSDFQSLIIKQDQLSDVDKNSKKIEGIEFITEDKLTKYTTLKNLVDSNEVSEDFFLQYIQSILDTPSITQDKQIEERIEPNNQTQLSDITNENEELKRAQKTDLVTLPEGINGTNCGNCKWINSDTLICLHKEVNQKVSDRMCCVLWDQVGTKRKWEQIKEEIKSPILETVLEVKEIIS